MNTASLNDFKATELASHEYIRNLPQSEKIKLAQLLQEETAINNLENLKTEYLQHFKESFPQLKALANAIRQHEVTLTSDAEIEDFWRISGDKKTDYELCQLAADISGYDDFFWDCVNKKNNTIETTNTAIADDATKKELMGHVMELYSFAAILKTTYDALPQVSEYTDAYECVRYTAEKLNTVAGKIEKFSW